MPITVADLEVRARANMRDAQRGLTGLQTQAERTAAGATGAFSRVGPAVTRGLQAGGAAAGVAFTASVNMAATFQDELATINTVARLGAEDTARLGDAIQQASRDSGRSTTELTQAYYDLLSAGTVAADDIEGGMAALNASTILATGGLATTGEAVDLLTTALNAYGLEAGAAGHVSDIFAVAVERGKVTAAEIAATLANAAPLASTMGIELEEISAAYSTLTARGVPAAEAMTQMNGAMRALINPNERLNAIQQQTGINFAELAREKGLHVALEELREVVGANSTALGELAGISDTDFPAALQSMQAELGLTNSEVEKFTKIAGVDGAAAAVHELAQEVGGGDAALAEAMGRVEGYNYVLQTTGQNAGAFGENLTAAMDAAGTASEQAAIKMDSPVEAGKRLVAGFQTFMQDVGGPFASSLGPVLFGINQIGPAFGGAFRMSQILGGGIGWLAGKALVPLIMGLGNATLATGRFGLAMLRQGAASVARFGVMLVATAVPAIIGFATTIFTTAIPALIALAAPFLPIILAVGAVVAVVAGLFLAWQTNFLGIRDIAATVWTAITGFIGSAIEWITGIIGGFMDFLSGLWNGVTEGASAVWDAVTGVIGGAVDAITGIIGGIVSVAQGVWDTVSGIFGAIGDAAAAVGDFIGGVGDAAFGWIPSFQKGTTYAPEGPAYLHEGEMVIPPDESAALRRFFAGPSGGQEYAPVKDVIQGGDVNVTIQAPMRPLGPEDVARPLRRLGALGILPTG